MPQGNTKYFFPEHGIITDVIVIYLSYNLTGTNVTLGQELLATGLQICVF